MQAPSRHLGHEKVPRHGRRLGDRRLAGQAQARGHGSLVHGSASRETRILAVLDDRHSEESRVLERPAQKRAVREPLSIVGDGDRAGHPHLAELGQLPSALSLGDRADRVKPRAGGAAAPSTRGTPRWHGCR